MEEKYLKVIESLGEILLLKDETIKFQSYEIESLKRKVEQIEQYVDCYINKEN